MALRDIARHILPMTRNWPANVTCTERAVLNKEFNASRRFTLNKTRDDLRAAGFSPRVRLFEAAAASPEGRPKPFGSSMRCHNIVGADRRCLRVSAAPQHGAQRIEEPVARYSEIVTEVTAIRADRSHNAATTIAFETGAGSVFWCDQITLLRSSSSPELIRGLACHSCFFGTNQPSRWVRGGPSQDQKASCASCWLLTDRPLECLGPTGPARRPSRPPSLRVAERSGFLCKTPANTGRACFWSASLVSLPQNRPPPGPSAQVRKGREGLETSSRRSRGESLTLEELL
jgi:hypothetical protein